MKKLCCSSLLCFFLSGLDAQIKILHKIIDVQALQPRDFKVSLDTIYKNLMDSSLSSGAVAGAKRTNVVLEFGDGSFTDAFNSDHAITINNQKSIAVVTTYYDTIDKPRSSFHGFTSLQPSADRSVPNNLPAGKMIKLIPYSTRTILYDNINKRLKDTFFSVIPYKNIKGVIAVYYNNESDIYFSPVDNAVPSSTRMKLQDLNSSPPTFNNVNLIRTYKDQEVFTSFSGLTAKYSQYAPKKDYFNYFMLTGYKFQHVAFIRINGDDNTEQNIFFDLKPLGNTADYAVSTDSTTRLLAYFFTDNVILNNTLPPPKGFFGKPENQKYTDNTTQRLSMQARDPNSLVTIPSCSNKFLDPGSSIKYRLTFYNDGAGDANEIHIKFSFNSKIDQGTINAINASLGEVTYTNPVLYVPAFGSEPPTSGFYYQSILCPYVIKNWLGQIITTFRPCYEFIFKQVNLRGTFQTPLSQIDLLTKGTLNFEIKTGNGNTFPDVKAEVYFNGGAFPVTAVDRLSGCYVFPAPPMTTVAN